MLFLAKERGTFHLRLKLEVEKYVFLKQNSIKSIPILYRFLKKKKHLILFLVKLGESFQIRSEYCYYFLAHNLKYHTTLLQALKSCWAAIPVPQVYCKSSLHISCSLSVKHKFWLKWTFRFEKTTLITCITRGSSVFSTDLVLISRFLISQRRMRPLPLSVFDMVG